MSHVIIGTAGHVDHGKSSLIYALTKRDPDRLAEEKERGITIELGFTWLEHPDGTRTGIIDVPGHERFVSNMLAGAGGIDLALLVVAADEGVMPQTREHLGILSLLGIKRGVIVVTKCDLVEEDFIDLVEEDVRDHVAGSFLEDAPMIRTSATTGNGIEELRQTLFDEVERISTHRDHLPFRLPIDRVFILDGFGTIVTGTLIEGTIYTGDHVEVYPGDKKARVRSIQIHEQQETVAKSGQRVALGLAGLKKADLERGDVLAFPESLMATTRIDVELTALQGTRFPVANNMRVHLFHGAREILARVILLDTDIVDPGATVHAQLRLEEEAYVKYGDRFVIRFYSPLETIGGGVIVDPLPAKRRRRRPINEPEFRIMASENKAERLALAILQGEHQLAPITMACYRAGITAEDRNALIRQLISDETIVMLNDRVAIHRKTLERLGEDATDILERFHRERSLESGMRREELRTRLLPRADIQLSDLVIDQLERAGYLNIAAGLVAKAGFKVTLSDAEKEVIEEIEALFAVAGFTPPGTDELFEKFNKRANAEQIITLLLNKGTLVRLTPQILMPKQLVDEAWNVVRTTIESEGQITLGDFRDKIKATRKFAIALLEFFDRQKKTKLVGDARVFN
ncbi:MAG TPA: selenocysteine-specific translation elongation factor [Bacillota bacterium]|jgi:selenocysteine-specific elongation factor|nr:selenocysteine-specific translation elongation factor [Bacillota bacterium]HQC48318.1 selenocysteine-specific translation elongation factor [Bacillota bacterium]